MKYPNVYSSTVYLQFSTDRSYLATSEGTALVQPAAISRLVIEAETRADDGMELMRVETFQAASPDRLPSEAELTAKVEKMAADLKALARRARRRAVCRSRVAFRPRRRRLLSRGSWAPARRASPARRYRRADVHKKSEPARAARIFERTDDPTLKESAG